MCCLSDRRQTEFDQCVVCLTGDGLSLTSVLSVGQETDCEFNQCVVCLTGDGLSLTSVLSV